jgi:hypothetical protein
MIEQINLDKDQVIQKIRSTNKEKEKAVSRLAKHFGIDGNKVFYEYMKGNLPDTGQCDDQTIFFFHGLGCSLNNNIENWSIDIEFGPKGEYAAYDKYTLCKILDFSIDECESLISVLMNDGVIRLADKGLFEKLNLSNVENSWSSVEEEIDVSVADRVVLIS